MRSLFATLVYTQALQARGAEALNAKLLRECRQLRRDDAGGRRWSARNYPGGYTSYSSAHRMHLASPTFAALARKLERHVRALSRALELEGQPLAMTDCWINIMSRHAVHGLHRHPLSTISGTYYVKTPRGCPGLKLEDPRLDRMMAAPPRASRGQLDRDRWVVIPAKAGHLVLFESWLRHEVPPNPVAAERVSISFNYNCF